MTVCQNCGEAMENSSYTLGAVRLPLRKRKDTEVKRDKIRILIIAEGEV